MKLRPYHRITPKLPFKQGVQSSFVLFFLLVATTFCTSCRKDFEYETSYGNLEFSKDTVFLDTIFTTIGSSTYSLKVYNRTSKDMVVPTIRLGQGQKSKYRLNVDGISGKEHQDIPILAKDSIFIFVETTFDKSNTGEKEFLYTDFIQFISGNAPQQQVPLVTLIRDAIFLFPSASADTFIKILPTGPADGGLENKVEGYLLDDSQLHFTKEKPYVIYGYATVPSEKTLVIDAGVRIHFHKNSGIFVEDDASLHINGESSSNQNTLEKEVVFDGDRLEPEFNDVPGQWGSIWLSNGSGENSFNHLTIKNATIGIFIEGDEISEYPDLALKNTQVYNSLHYNLWAKTADLIGENVVLGGAGKSSLYCHLGGNYSFVHCTIANYWNHGFRVGQAVKLDNNLAEGVGTDLERANFVNCIVDGNSSVELVLESDDTTVFNFSFTNCMIKFKTESLPSMENNLYNFKDTILYKDILLNLDADFSNGNINDFRIGNLSAAKNRANENGAQRVPFDILGENRETAPDIGAYQHIPID